MSNYKGYFRSLESNDLYCVYIITNNASTAYTEVTLAGDSPFVVNYNESQTPFDPVRTSTATIQVVRDDYLEDVYSPYAHGTAVKLRNETKGTWEWVGFLVPRIYNQGYEDCNETIQLEAADCLSSLQYFDYFTVLGGPTYGDYDIDVDDTKSIASFSDILANICDQCELLDGYYWTRSKKVGNTIMLPDHLMVSEQNWFSSDTDEPVKMSEVLEDICTYLGFTAVQWKTHLYFIDYKALSANEDLYMTYFSKAGGYTGGTNSHKGEPFTITADTYRGNGASISFEPVYNKVTVRDNFYTADDIVPSIFDDKYLTNRIVPCNFYETYEVATEIPNKPSYPGGGTEEVGDSTYRYFHRPYTHKYWDSVYRDTANTQTALTDSVLATVAPIRDYAGGTIVDMGTVRNTYTNITEGHRQRIVAPRRDFQKYLCISQKGITSNEVPVLKLKSGYHPLCPYSSNAYLVINYTCVFERYVNRGYINPEWTTDTGTWSGVNTAGFLKFRVKIGDWWWWYNPTTSDRPPFDFDYSGLGGYWTKETYSPLVYQNGVFPVMTEYKSDSTKGTVQEDMTTLNTVSWEDEINVEGYKIPLAGMSMLDDISIEVFNPNFQFQLSGGNTSWNQYCWVKDLSFKIVEQGQDIEQQENDVVYENVIDTDAINELGEITVKLTTFTEHAQPSYSNVVYHRGNVTDLLTNVTEDAISGTPQKPEENIVEKYVLQYSTPTKKIQATQTMDITPLSKIYNADVDNPTDAYISLGGEIDYAAGSQSITMLQLK